MINIYFRCQIIVISLYFSIITGAFLCAAEIPVGVSVSDQEFNSWIQAWNKKSEVSGFSVHVDKDHYLNSLILTQSPYLIQHASNPINWTTWSENSLQKAQKQNRLIFLSIGYSTCHWCHVMNRESFSDVAIAQLINENFIAIKVDREEMPSVDHYYSELLAKVKGSSGWPLTAILDAQGKPIFLESYLDSEKLTNLLTSVVKLQNKQPAALTARINMMAAMFSESVLPDEGEISPLALHKFSETASRVLDKMDKHYGGFSGTQKFPSEPSLRFLQTIAVYNPDPDLRAAVSIQLNNMLLNGLYDSVNGGFFRYSTRSDWKAPHFEKMLYNQGMLLGVYASAYISDNNSIFKWATRDMTNFLMSWMYSPDDGGFYSAVDADYEGQEGAYYSWPVEHFKQLDTTDKHDAGFDYYSLPEQVDTFTVIMAQPDTEPAERIRNNLSKSHKNEQKPFIDKKIITAWNALIISGLADSVTLADKADTDVALQEVVRIANNLWHAVYDDDNSTLYRTLLQGKVSIKANLQDHAFLLNAMLDVYDLTQEYIWLVRSEVLSKIILRNYIDKNGGFLVKDITADSMKKSKPFTESDSEMPAADAVAVEGLWRFHERTGKQEYSKALSLAINKLRARFINDPLNNLYAGKVLMAIDLGSLNTLQYFARGNGRIEARQKKSKNTSVSDCSAVSLDFSMKQGWHINSSEPLQDYLKPTVVKAIEDKEKKVEVIYPVPNIKSLDFQGEKLSLYEGKFTIEIDEFSCDQSSLSENLQLDIQACSNKICLLPERLTIAIPPWF